MSTFLTKIVNRSVKFGSQPSSQFMSSKMALNSFFNMFLCTRDIRILRSTFLGKRLMASYMRFAKNLKRCLRTLVSFTSSIKLNSNSSLTDSKLSTLCKLATLSCLPSGTPIILKSMLNSLLLKSSWVLFGKSFSLRSTPPPINKPRPSLSKACYFEPFGLNSP